MEKKKHSPDTVRSVLGYFVFGLILLLLLCFYSQDQEYERAAEEAAYAAIIRERTINRLDGNF